jgi:hypothetical protein
VGGVTIYIYIHVYVCMHVYRSKWLPADSLFDYYDCGSLVFHTLESTFPGKRNAIANLVFYSVDCHHND